MNPERLAAAALAWLAAGLAVALPAGSRAAGPDGAAAPTVAEAFDGALEAYRQRQWSDAWRGLSALADAGHPAAARLALQMWQDGAPLNGVGFDADTKRRERWSAFATGAGPDGPVRYGAAGC